MTSEQCICPKDCKGFDWHCKACHPDTPPSSNGISIRVALEKLTNEIRGVMGYDEAGLRDLIGNTNFNVLMQQVLAAMEVLESLPVETTSRHPESICTVINNNQPGWTNIVETAPNVTLPVGTKLYDESALISVGCGVIAGPPMP